MCEALEEKERKRERQDRDGEKGRKEPDTKGQIFYHSIYRLVPSEVAELRAVASNDGGGLDRRSGATVKVEAASGVIAVKHCDPTGVTSPGLLAHTCSIKQAKRQRQEEPGKLQTNLKFNTATLTQQVKVPGQPG